MRSESRRRGPRRQRTFVLAAIAAAAWLLSLGAAYRAGTAEQEARLVRVTAELELQGRLVRDLGRRAAEAELQLTDLRASLEPPEPPAEPGAATREELRSLGELVDRRLRAGLTVAELQAAVIAAQPAPRCEAAPQSRQLIARTPALREASSARFTAEKVVVSASGAAARAGVARSKAAGLDVEKPVAVRFEVAGVAFEARGLLPVRHVVRKDALEYRFEVMPRERDGKLEVQLVVCHLA